MSVLQSPKVQTKMSKWGHEVAVEERIAKNMVTAEETRSSALHVSGTSAWWFDAYQWSLFALLISLYLLDVSLKTVLASLRSDSASLRASFP